MQVTIRPVEAQNGPVLRDVILRMLADSPDAFSETLTEAKQRSDQQWQDRAKRMAGGIERAGFLAQHGEWVCGFVMAVVGEYRNGRPDFSVLNCVTVARTWVDPAVRRQGVGRALMKAALDWARRRGITRIELQVTVGNEAAERFYRELGFEDTGHREPLASNRALQIRFLQKRRPTKEGPSCKS